jgi:hypothetical protein
VGAHPSIAGGEAADVEAFTCSTTFTVMLSMRLDLGAGSQVRPRQEELT